MGNSFTIYAASDDTYLRYVLNALAMLQSDGVFTGLAAIGLVIGLILAAARNVQGDPRGLSSLFLGLVCFMVSFGPTTNVTVVGSLASTWYTSQTYTVANVPFGPAAVGYVISNVGELLSQKMVQAFAYPGYQQQNILNGGYNRSLDWLTVGQYFKNPELNSGDGAFGGYRNNVLAYIESCSSRMLEKYPNRTNTMFNTGTPFDTTSGLGFDSTWDAFTYIDKTGTSTLMTCTKGADQLATDEQNILPTAVPNAMANVFHESQTQAQQDVGNAWQMYGANQQDWIRFYGNQMINEAILEAGPNIPGLNQGQINNILMVKAAAMQRAEKYAGEESMFRRMVGPMMSFLEAVLYISAPFMAFAMCLGAFGLKGLTRYLSLAVSVAMWIPILSAIDLFQIVRVNEVLAPYLDPNLNPQQLGTILSTMTAYGDIDDIIATGSWLTVTMPGLVTFMVMGGTFALSQIYGGMRGGEFVNYQTNAPNPVNAPPAMNLGSPMEKSAVGVAHAGGAAMPSLAFGNSASVNQSLSSTQQESAQVGGSLSHMQSSANGIIASRGSSNSSMTGVSGSGTHSVGSNTSDSRSVADSTSVGSGWSEKTDSSASRSHNSGVFANTNESLSADASVSPGVAGLAKAGSALSKTLGGLGLGGSGSFNGGQTRGSTETGGLALQHGTTYAHDQQGKTGTSADHSTSSGSTTGYLQQLSQLASTVSQMTSGELAQFSKQIGDSGTQQLTKAFSDATAFSNAVSAQHSSGASVNVPLDTAVGAYRSNNGGGDGSVAAGRAMAAYHEAGGDPQKLATAANDPHGAMAQAFGGDKNSRMIGAALTAMASSDNPMMQAAYADLVSSNGISALAPVTDSPSQPAGFAARGGELSHATEGPQFNPNPESVGNTVNAGLHSAPPHSGAPGNPTLGTFAPALMQGYSSQAGADGARITGEGNQLLNGAYPGVASQVDTAMGQVGSTIQTQIDALPKPVSELAGEGSAAVGRGVFNVTHPNEGVSKPAPPSAHASHPTPTAPDTASQESQKPTDSQH